jgi:hypothetical protein
VARPTSHTAADVFVIFGITGDLAKKMTLRSLYRLEARGLLDCPIVGVAVDDWTHRAPARPRPTTRSSRPASTVDEKIFARFAKRLSYVSGDFAQASTFAAVAKAIGSAKTPVYYLEIPPFLFATVVAGLCQGGDSAAHRTRRGRETVRARPRVRAGARRRAAHPSRRDPALPDRPLPRQDGPAAVPLPALRQHDARAGLEPPATSRACRSRWPRILRRRGPRPLLRPGRRAA